MQKGMTLKEKEVKVTFKITAEEKALILKRRKAMAAPASLWQVIIDGSIEKPFLTPETRTLFHKINYAIYKATRVEPNIAEAAIMLFGLLNRKMSADDTKNILFKAAMKLGIEVPHKSF